MSTTTYNGFTINTLPNGAAEVFSPITGEWVDFPSYDAAIAKLTGHTAPQTSAPTSTGWSKAARAYDRRPGCQHHETSNTGSCYSCGAYASGSDAATYL